MKKILALAFLVLALTSCTTIEPGYVGIKVDKVGTNRTVDNVETVVGRVLYNPINTDIIEFPYTTQRFEWWGEESLKFSSREGVRIGVDVAVSLGVDREKAASIYVKYRKTLDQLIDNEIRDRVNGCMNRAAASMSVDEIVGERRNVWLDNTLACITERVVAEGFILNDFQITSEFDVPPSIKAKIEEQIQAQQAAIAAENKVREVEAVARQHIAEADGRRQAAILEAQGQAEAIRVINEELSRSPDYLQYYTIQQWDGVMPLYNGNSGAPLNLFVNPQSSR